MTATELALALSSLETTQESARAVVEDSTSTTTDLTARPSSSKEVTLPLGGKSSAARDFAISTELLNSVLENVSEKYVATATRPLRQGETASARARELGAESVQIEASAQVLQRPPAQEGQATLTRAGYPGTSLSQSMKATSEERMELTKLLERYSEDVEVGKLIQDLVSERIEFTSSMVQEMIATVSELQKTPQSESTSHSVASALREVIAKAVKQAVEETVFTIVQYAETTSTTQLATALATSATVGSRLRAAEQEEAAIVVKLVRSILEDRTMTMPEEHRAYIQERFGIHVDTDLLSNKVDFSASVVQEIITAMKELEKLPQSESTSKTAAELVRNTVAKVVKETVDETVYSIVQSMESASATQLAMALIAAQKSNMSATAVSEIQKTIDLHLQHAEESGEVRGEAAERIRAALTKCIGELTDETVHTLWRTASTTTSSAHEFGYETTGTLSTHGYLQPRPEEQATAESTVIQARRLVDDRTVSASQQEDVQRREELRKDVSTATAEITSVARVQDSSSQTMAASQEELATRAVEYLRTEQKYGVGATQAEKQSVSVGESTQETRDEAAYGVWTTAVDEETQTTISQGERTQEQLSRSVQATMEQSTAMSADFMDASSAEISSTVKLERTDSTSREFSIQQQQYESMLRKEETAVEQSSTMRDVMTATDTALVHEFGSDDVNVSGVLGHLTPKKPESAEVATQLSLAPHLEAVTSMSASTEASIQETGLIRRDEAMESTSMEQVTTIKDSTLLSTAATKEEQAEVDYRRARGSTSYGVGKSISSSSIDAAQITSKEAGETAVFGVWDSSITAEESQRTIREKSMESTDVALSTKASEMETVRSEVDLSKEPSDHAVSVLSEAQREGGRRGFSIEHLDVTTSYQRCAMGEIAVTTEKDVVVVSSTGSAAEYAREQAEVVAVLGTIEPHDEQFENAAIKVEDSKKLQLEKKMRAAEEFTTDDQLMMRREELSLQSERTIRETTVEREIQAMKASEHTSAEQVISLAAADQKEASDVEVTDRNTAASTATVQESTDEAIQGIWRTPSGAEAVYTLKEKEKSVERGALSTKASREEDVYTDAQRIRDIAGGIEGHCQKSNVKKPRRST
ncbi:hypothetical protein ANCCEY_11987 [Ancylostoma ceylanicum]|uniref:Uncharacterized protein n=1 Tax=Ancylostoma ceylanicum TaxID=53326 RepID=A0A0D6LAA6_9BILA|nr:hypothetical protein ANCCEY_11987 [Ancylostoma ceylanicum]